MITTAVQSTPTESVQQCFERLLPHIERIAWKAYRQLNGNENHEAGEEYVQDVRGVCWEAYQRGLSKGREFTARNLAFYACKRVRAGRSIVPSSRRSIDNPHRKAQTGQCREEWYEDSLSELARDNDNPADVAAFRIDGRAWFASLSPTSRKTLLAVLNPASVTANGGMSGKAIAHALHITPGRLSQRRRELLESYLAFTADPDD